MATSERMVLRDAQPVGNYGLWQQIEPAQRKTRLRQFQCCVIGMFTLLVIVLSVVLTSYAGSAGSNPNFEPPSTTSLLNDESVVLRAAVDAGTAALRARDIFEEHAVTLRSASPSFRHQKAIATSRRANSLARMGYAMHHASSTFANNKYNCSRPMHQICNVSTIVAELDWSKHMRCAPDALLPCAEYMHYRTMDGSCNNLQHPDTWGVAFTSFRRLLPASYADGVGAPRSSVLINAQLPSAKRVSDRIHWPLQKQDPNFTVMLAVWGQFLDHDITATAQSRGPDGDLIACCGTTPMHPECFPVFNGDGDSDFAPSCSEFVRSAPAATCCLGPREQMNQASAYIDGSVVYGSDAALTLQLRTSDDSGELLMMHLSDGRELLPASQDPADGCNQKRMNLAGKYCFVSGDARANENVHLTSMHLVWARQHNLMARGLRRKNAHWSAERIFQEARRIIGAQLQHITYTEFLPAVLGDRIVTNAGLRLAAQGYFQNYNASMDASIANSFAAAAFRFAHSMIPGLMQLLANDTGSPEFVKMREMLFDPYRLYEPGELDRMLRGAMRTQLESADTHFNSEVTAHLFEAGAGNSSAVDVHCKSGGLDLVALNVQRGRDHGLPGYAAWRDMCGARRPRDFNDLRAYMDDDSVNRIIELYAHVDDVDLYTGAVSETPLPGSLLGQTATCIIVDQFRRLRYGDRFWYERSAAGHGFTLAQLTQVRHTSLAAVICDNADHIDTVPRHVMRRQDAHNALVPCAMLPRLDLNPWTEEAP